MSRFKIGDRVAINPEIKDVPKLKGSGTARIVKESSMFTNFYLIVTDDGTEYSTSEDLLIKVPEINIYQLGETIVAQSNDDTITVTNSNFYEGAKTALENLVADITAPYNAKVVCISSDNGLFTVGKIYPVEDGFLKSGETICNDTAYRSFKALEADVKNAKFVQLVN